MDGKNRFDRQAIALRRMRRIDAVFAGRLRQAKLSFGEQYLAAVKNIYEEYKDVAV